MRRTISAGVSRSPSDRGDLTARFGGNDDSRGDIVGMLAQERGGLEPVGGDERLLAAGASQVAQPAWQGARIDGPQGVGADADIVLIVKFSSVVGMKPVPVQPGSGTSYGPEQFVERRDRDHTQDGLSRDDQADADGPEGQAVDHVSRAVDRVDRPAPGAGASCRFIFLASE